MPQAQQIIIALKKRLRANAVTYKQVASVLNLSEASIKRMLANGDLSLSRLETIAATANCSLSDLIRDAAEQEDKVVSLTLEQEAVIADDLILLLVAISVISGFTFADLLQHYAIDQHTLVQKLAQLDRMRLIELQPANRIKLQLAPSFQWQPNGPIQRFFLNRVAQEFLASNFDQAHERLLVINGLCTQATNDKIQKRMHSTLNEVATLLNEDRNQPLTKKRGNTLVMALRQWQFDAFERLKRHQ